MFTKLYIEGEEGLKKSLSENPNASIFEVLEKTGKVQRSITNPEKFSHTDVIGKTRSGKSVFRNVPIEDNPHHYKGWTKEDHHDAAAVHATYSNIHEMKGYSSNHKGDRTRAETHGNWSNWHMDHSDDHAMEAGVHPKEHNDTLLSPKNKYAEHVVKHGLVNFKVNPKSNISNLSEDHPIYGDHNTPTSDTPNPERKKENARNAAKAKAKEDNDSVY